MIEVGLSILLLLLLLFHHVNDDTLDVVHSARIA